MAANPDEQNVEQSFKAFFEGWLLRKQNLLDQLLRVSAMPMPDSANKIEHRKRLIDEVLSHYQQYFEEKTRVANVNVFLLFSPTWLSAYERAMLWIGDYKPSLILRLADGAVEELTAEQKQRLGQLKDETKRAEREVSEAMARVQESVAGPHMVGLARQIETGRVLNGGETSELKRNLMGVLDRANELRASTATKVVAVLSPPQTVLFLAAAAHFQLLVRRWGLQKDSSSVSVSSP